jgi:NAD(P)-dependent dehydrogenase (short-subunit alcohol dehydrogenase family)
MPGSGIGLTVASYLLSQGWMVVISDKDAVVGEKAAAELGCKFFAADITNYDQLAQAFALTWQQYHRLDFGADTFLSLSQLLC